MVLQFSGDKVMTLHINLVRKILSDSSLLEAPGLVFALVLVPDGYGSARGGIAKVREIDIEVRVVDEDADEKGPSV